MSNWHEVNTIEDIKGLLEYYEGFHDSCIKELRYTSGAWVDNDRTMVFGESKDRQVDIVFQRQWNPITIELRFIGMITMNIAGWQRYYSCDIYDCYLAFHNDLVATLDGNLIIWADNAGFNPKNLLERDILSESQVSFIVAEKLFWR